MIAPDIGDSTPAPETTRRGRNPFEDVLWLFLTLAPLTIATMASHPPMESDIWWHLRTGQWIVAHGAVPTQDSFSSHAMGQPWIDYTWLFDVLVYKIFNSWGYRAILALTTIVSFVTTAWTVVFLARFTSLGRAMALTVLASFALMPLKTPRPWLFTILFFSIELSLLWIARERNRPVWLLPIVPLFAIWANVHIQFVYGLSLIGLFALERSVPAPTRDSLSAEPEPQLSGLWLWMLLAASFAATLLNPYGWNLYRVVAQYANQTAPLAIVKEMQAIPFRGIADWTILLLICSAIFVLGCARRKNLLLISLMAVACVFGFRSSRDVWFPVTIAILALAYGSKPDMQVLTMRHRFTYWMAMPVSFLIILVFTVYNDQFSEASLRQNVNKNFPEKAASYIETHGLQGPLYNSFNWGGYLIWRLPGLPVSIDGRANLYEDSLPVAVKTMKGQKDWAQDPDLKKARTILLEQDSSLVTVLRSDARFRLLYEDEMATVFQPVNP